PGPRAAAAAAAAAASPSPPAANATFPSPRASVAAAAAAADIDSPPAVAGEFVSSVPELLISPEPHTLDDGLDGGLPAVPNENDGIPPAPTSSPPLLPPLT
ncbi:unnamed protein product, partial [Ectocarpus sp. 6 AP-2014]